MSTEASDRITMDPTDDLSPGRAGFTLVEMLVTVVITGAVGAALLGVFLEQNAFYQENTRVVTANSSLRSTTARMSTELKMVHQGDVVTAEADRLSARHGVMHGVVCHVDASSVFIYLHRVPDTEPSTVRYLEPRFDGNWQTGLSWGNLSQDTNETCADHGAPKGQPAEHYQQVGLTPWPTSPKVGSLVYGTDRVTYSIESRGGELYLVRNGRAVTGSFEQSSQYFHYLDGNGGEVSAPVTGSSLDDIAVVRFEATALGDEPNNSYRGDRTIRLRIPFRN